MMKLAAVRRMALSLPETTEQDHHGRASFRVQGKIFATVPDSTHLNVMLDPYSTSLAVSADPEACAELWWGKQLCGVRVNLSQADERAVADLLDAAWRRKAAKRLGGSASTNRSRRKG